MGLSSSSYLDCLPALPLSHLASSSFSVLLAPGRPHLPPRPEPDVRHRLCLLRLLRTRELTPHLFVQQRDVLPVCSLLFPQFNPLPLPHGHLGPITSPWPQFLVSRLPALTGLCSEAKCGLSKAQSDPRNPSTDAPSLGITRRLISVSSLLSNLAHPSPPDPTLHPSLFTPSLAVTITCSFLDASAVSFLNAFKTQLKHVFLGEAVPNHHATF